MFDQTTQNSVLEEAINAARNGDRIKAKDKLTRYLRYDQKNEQAWLWMSAVVDSDRERIFCLTNALKLNPNNKTVKRGLALLGALPNEMKADLDIEVIGVDLKAETTYASPNGGTAANKGKAAKRGGGFAIRRNRTLENISIVALALILIVGCVTIGFNLFNSRLVVASLIGIGTYTPTATLTPVPPTLTITPSPVPPTATEFAPTAPVAGINETPISVVIGVAYTPTPVAIEIPFFPEEAFSHGEKAYQEGFYETALSDFQKAAEDNPSNFAARYYTGLIYLERKNYNQAFGAFGAALKINASYAPALLGRGQATFGLGGNPLGDYNKAKAAAPNWPDPYIQTAVFYASRRDPDTAISELETARQLAPDHVVVIWHLAEQYLAVGRIEECRALIKRGYEIDQTALDLYRVDAALALVDGDAQFALDRINIYLSYVPTNPDGWTLQGQAFLGLGQYNEALEALNKAIDLNPFDPRVALISRGTVELALDNKEAADADFSRAFSLGVTTRNRLLVGQAYYNDGQYEDAVTQFRRAVVADTTLFDTHYWLGTALIAAGEYEEALDELGEALSRADSDLRQFTVYTMRAKAYDVLDRREEAIQDLREALILNITGHDPERDEALLMLSRLGGPEISTTETPTPGP